MEQGGQVGMARGTTVGVVSGDCSLGVNYWSSCDSLCLMGILLACSPPHFLFCEKCFSSKEMGHHNEWLYSAHGPSLNVSICFCVPTSACLSIALFSSLLETGFQCQVSSFLILCAFPRHRDMEGGYF